MALPKLALNGFFPLVMARIASIDYRFRTLTSNTAFLRSISIETILDRRRIAVIPLQFFASFKIIDHCHELMSSEYRKPDCIIEPYWFPLMRENYLAFNNVDIKDDMQMGLSLKAIEGHLGLSVQETTVSFDLPRPLTKEELEETIFYCKHDVDTTERVMELRKNYLKSKVSIGRLAGLSDVRAMAMTNAKLTAAMLSASKKTHKDERKYRYPENLKREYIPQEVFDFFDKMYDPSISDKELFGGKLDFSVGDCPGVIGYGGIHAAIPNYIFEQHGDRRIINKDVASYYPHLMTLCGYTSRNIPSPETFSNVLETRMRAKASGDKATANALKLVVNTTYGAMLNKFNDLYDPLMGRSVCITIV